MKMSKMRMPEMSVVRFNESDVIVASTVEVLNWTNQVAFDGVIKRGNAVIYNHTESGRQTDHFTGLYGTNPRFYPDEDDSHAFDLSYLIQSDNTAGTLNDTNGTYEWINGAFSRISN